MKEQNVLLDVDADLTAVLAYTDAAFDRERNLWRGFLSYILPNLFSLELEVIEEHLAAATFASVNDLHLSRSKKREKGEAMRIIAMQLAKEIGVSPEFSLACFYEGQSHTRLYKMKSHLPHPPWGAKQEKQLLSSWFNDFALAQEKQSFLGAVEEWREWMTTL